MLIIILNILDKTKLEKFGEQMEALAIMTKKQFYPKYKSKTPRRIWSLIYSVHLFLQEISVDIIVAMIPEFLQYVIADLVFFFFSKTYFISLKDSNR